MPSAGDGARGSRHLEHPASLYASPAEFLEVIVPYVREGVEARQPILITARGDYLPALRDEIGSAPNLTLADTYDWHPHPATRLRALHEFVSDKLETGVSGIRIAAEPVWPSHSPELTREWQRYESALNAVLAPFPASLLCLYDASRLDADILATAHRTHPAVRTDGSVVSSAAYEDPAEFVNRWRHEASMPPPDAATIEVLSESDLWAARRLVNDEARNAGLSPARAADLCMAANEIVTNAVVHADGGRLTAWTDARRLVCLIEDRGHGIADPLAGYWPPPYGGHTGRGLWLARQLVDLLRIMRGSAGAVVELDVDIEDPARPVSGRRANPASPSGWRDRRSAEAG